MKQEEKSKLTEELRQKLITCKNLKDRRTLIADAGIIPLSDEEVDAIAAGQYREPDARGIVEALYLCFNCLQVTSYKFDMHEDIPDMVDCAHCGTSKYYLVRIG